jgi:hypothetical protein
VPRWSGDEIKYGIAFDVPNVTYDWSEEDKRSCLNYLKWARDCGAALIVGGATFALTMMLGGGVMQNEVVIAFGILYFLIFDTLMWLGWRLSGRYLRHRVSRQTLLWLAVLGPLIMPVVLGAIGPQYPLSAYSVNWWFIVGISLVVTIAGTFQRHVAESEMEDVRLATRW